MFAPLRFAKDRRARWFEFREAFSVLVAGIAGFSLLEIIGSEVLCAETAILLTCL